MSAKPKGKHKVRFRVRVGNRYCTLSKKYHEKGVVIPEMIRADDDACAVFTTQAKAQAAIDRTTKAQQMVRSSLLESTPMFGPLLFKGLPQIEEFWVVVHEPA